MSDSTSENFWVRLISKEMKNERTKERRKEKKNFNNPQNTNGKVK